MSPIAKSLILLGILIILIGLLWNWIPFGRLPGDLTFNRGNVRFYLPLGTSLLISLILSLLLTLLRRFL